MKTVTLLCLLFCNVVGAAGQINVKQVQQELAAVRTVDEGRAFLKQQNLMGEVMVIDSRIDSSAFARELFRHKVGDVFQPSTNDPVKSICKVLEEDHTKSYRVHYIFLDNDRMSIHKIDSIRNLILERLKRGESFSALAQRYSMDPAGAKGGDSGWFEEGTMIRGFEDAVKARPLSDTYKVDITEKNWYYLVRNTHKPRIDKRAVVLYCVLKKTDEK